MGVELTGWNVASSITITSAAQPGSFSSIFECLHCLLETHFLLTIC